MLGCSTLDSLPVIQGKEIPEFHEFFFSSVYISELFYHLYTHKDHSITVCTQKHTHTWLHMHPHTAQLYVCLHKHTHTYLHIALYPGSSPCRKVLFSMGRSLDTRLLVHACHIHHTYSATQQKSRFWVWCTFCGIYRLNLLVQNSNLIVSYVKEETIYTWNYGL